MKKVSVLVFCLFVVAAGLIFSGGSKGRDVPFTLVAAGGDPSPISFALAPKTTSTASLPGAGLSGVIEDSDYPYNTAVGWQTLLSNSSGFANAAFGYQALLANSTGAFNTGVGYQTLLANSTGYENTAVGYEALMANTEGVMNAAFGERALAANTTGNFNTALGSTVLWKNTTGSRNTAAGQGALSQNTTGEENTVQGWAALSQNTTGKYNTAVGLMSLYWSTEGNYNTALGIYAGDHLMNGNFNIYLGARVPGAEDDNNTIRIGSAYDTTRPDFPWGQNRTFIAGIVDFPMTAASNPAVVGITSDGQLGTMAAALLPPGPKGDKGDKGDPGEGFVPGSLLLLPAGVAPPAGYTLLGTTTFAVKAPGGRTSQLTVNIYRKQ